MKGQLRLGFGLLGLRVSRGGVLFGKDRGCGRLVGLWVSTVFSVRSWAFIVWVLHDHLAIGVWVAAGEERRRGKCCGDTGW